MKARDAEARVAPAGGTTTELDDSDAFGANFHMDKSFALHFAKDWIESWNSHDVDRILAHYTDDFEMTSPVIVQLMGVPSGSLKGRAEVGAYWRQALQRMPEICFELVCVLVGVTSVTIHYKGAKGRLAAEVFHFNAQGKVEAAVAHYAA